MDTEEWRMPWRIPHDQISLFPPDALRERTAMPAGVRIACHTDTEFIAGQIEPTRGEPEEENSRLDLYCDGEASTGLSGWRDGRSFGLTICHKARS